MGQDGSDMAGHDAPTAKGSGFEGLTDHEREVLVRVVEVLRKINFGTVLLVVQDGKVVQIEMAEKIRLR